MSKTISAVLMSVAACAATATPAAASTLPDPVWLDTVEISAPGDASGQGLFGDANDRGDVMVAWSVNYGGDPRIRAAFRPAGGAWATPTFISPAGVSIYGYSVTHAADGDFVLALQIFDGVQSQATVTTLDSQSGQWSSLDTVSDPATYTSSVSLAASGDGSMHLLYAQDKLYLRSRAAGETAWSDPQIVDSSGTAYQGQIAANADGSLTAGWNDGAVVRFSDRASGSGSWSTPHDIPLTQDAVNTLRLSTDPAGDGLGAVWIEADNGGTPMDYSDDLPYATFARRSGGTWTTPYQGPAGTLTGWTFFGAEHDLVGGWINLGGGVTTSTIGMPASSSVFDSPEAFGSGPVSAIAGVTRRRDGSLFGIAFTGGMPPNTDISVVKRQADGSWPATYQIEDQTISLQDGGGVASDGLGNVISSWETGANTVVVRVGDGAPPTISGIDVPAAATTGEQVPVSASANDAWSAVESVRWSFGDGSEGTGENASHAYSVPGSYTVTVTATDSVGHSSSETRTVVVAAPPAADPPAPPAPPAKTTTTTTPPVVTPPVIEAKLAGKTVTINAKLTLKAGKRCAGTVKASTAFGGRTYKATLRLVNRSGACRATGAIKLKKTPSLRTKLRVTVTGGQAKSRTLTTRRG